MISELPDWKYFYNFKNLSRIAPKHETFVERVAKTEKLNALISSYMKVICTLNLVRNKTFSLWSKIIWNRYAQICHCHGRCKVWNSYMECILCDFIGQVYRVTNYKKIACLQILKILGFKSETWRMVWLNKTLFLPLEAAASPSTLAIVANPHHPYWYWY